MSAIRKLVIAVVGVITALVAVPALAQNSYERVVIALLTLQHRYEDFERDAFPDWTGALRHIDQNRQVEQSYRLEAGVTYRFVGSCDQDCRNMDMEVFAPDGTLAGENRLPDDRPFVEITPTEAGTYRVHPWVVECRARPCYGGLRVLKRQPRLRSGTAFLISNAGHLLTAAHVVENRTNITIFVGDQEVPARVISRDPANDVALLQAEITGTPLFLASATSMARGQEVMTLGYPLVDMQGVEQKASFGRVNALSGLEDDLRHMQVDVPIQPGNSGGPLLNARGDVVGIMTMTINQRRVMANAGTVAQNVNYALKIDYVLPMLPADARNPGPPPPAASGFEQTASRSEASVYRINAQ